VEARRAVGARHPTSADPDRHEPARPGQAQRGLRRPVLRRRLRPTVPGAAAPVGRPATAFVDHWATEHETRDQVVGLARRVWAHADATIDELELDARGHVPWWGEEVPLLNVMAARLVDAVRHAGHADILRSGSTVPSGSMPTVSRCTDVTAPTGMPGAPRSTTRRGRRTACIRPDTGVRRPSPPAGPPGGEGAGADHEGRGPQQRARDLGRDRVTAGAPRDDAPARRGGRCGNWWAAGR
jgi:hypothetical protein